MNMPLYTIKDDLTGYGVPFATDNDGTAMRYFNQAFNADNSIYSQNPEHFNLYFVGNFDNQSGEIDCDKPRYVCSALDFRKDK